MLIKNILSVGFGSFLGGVLRYGVGLLMLSLSLDTLWGTLAVNILGCFLIGLFTKSLASGSSWALFAMVGFCGGFTTFSTFSKEVLSLLSTAQYLWAGIYILLSLLLGLGAVLLGFYVGTSL